MTDEIPNSSIIVVGAGVAGIMTAYALARRGQSVTVIDALAGPAEMCSRANAGIIAVGHAKAWAGSKAIGGMLKAVLGRDRSVRVTKLKDPALWYWGLEFLFNCTRSAHDSNTDKLRRLCRYSRDLFATAEREMGFPKEVRHQGGLYLFQDKVLFDAYVASFVNRVSNSIEVLNRNQLIAREPVLARLSDRLVGGIFSAADSVGDCRLFTQRTAEYLKRMPNVCLRFNTRVTGFRCAMETIKAVKTDGGEIPCAALILATGIETPEITRPLGFHPNIYPVKGYSGTWQIVDPTKIPALPYVDESELLAVANYGGKLRVTAIAEFAARDRSISEISISQIGNYVQRSFGDAVNLETPEFWSGLRPTTAAGPPYLGQVRKFRNLWINAGHGQLGWTMSLGCGELLAQRITGELTSLRGVSATAPWLDRGF